jgi:hypothetical protein
VVSTPLVIPNTVQVRWFWTLNGVDAVNVVHAIVQPAFVPTPAIAQALFSAIATQWGGSLATPWVPASTTFEKVDIRDIRAANLAPVESSAGSVPGADAAMALPNQVAAVLTLRTANAGKSFRGRIFMPGFSMSAQGIDGHMAPGFVDNLSTFGSTLIAAFSGNQMTLAVASRPVHDKDTGALIKAGFSTQVTQVVVRDNRWDTQRRRLQ